VKGEITMTRAQIKEMFPDATEEQIKAILDANSADIGKAKKAAEAEAQELEQLRDKARLYDEAEEAKKTAEQKLADALKKAEQLKAENQKILNRTKAASVFATAGISEAEYSTILDGIVTTDEQATLALVENMVTLIKAKTEATEKAVKEELLKSTPTPPAGGSGGDTTITKEQFDAMGYSERLKLFNEQPELYKQFIGGIDNG
jgi:DNA repair exonuclease SbcCD ATPase subunit